MAQKYLTYPPGQYPEGYVFGQGTPEYEDAANPPRTNLALAANQAGQFMGDQYGASLQPRQYQAPLVQASQAAPVQQPTMSQQELARSLTLVSPDGGIQTPSQENNYAGTDVPSGDGWKTWLNAGISQASALGQQGSVNSMQATQTYNQQINAMPQVDLNSDVRPDEATYMQNLPSKVESISGSTWTGGKLTGGGYEDKPGQTFAVGMFNPIGQWTEALGGKKYAGVAEYSGNKAGQGALSGASSGWQGAVVGAIVGAISGVFEWKSAKEQDASTKKQAQAQFLAAVKEWEAKRAKARGEARLAKIKEKKEEKERVGLRRSASVNTKRAMFMKLIEGASQTGQAAAPRNYVAPTLGGR